MEALQVLLKVRVPHDHFLLKRSAANLRVPSAAFH